ncbi:MAG: hypothetical protein ACP5OA_05930 [Candidatus Woesearchaeota archaeon]
MVTSIKLRQAQKVVIKHWFPIITICPVTRLPDLNYIRLETSGKATIEIGSWREEIFKHRFEKIFLEDLIFELSKTIPKGITYNIHGKVIFSRHEVEYRS